MTDFKIRALFVGPYQSYHLYYSDLKEQFVFKWDYNKMDTLVVNKIREFKWFDTIREAMIDVCKWNLNNNMIPSYSHNDNIGFIRFTIDNCSVEDLEFLNFI